MMDKEKGTESQLLERWQIVINLIAQHYDVPACLIMKLDGGNIKVELSSDSDSGNNPYSPGDNEHFDNSGLYCERVIKTQKLLQVANALTNPEWDENPDIKLNMISYLGVPLNWPDKSPFGTLCVLDNKEREFPEDFRELLEHLSHVFELELSLVEEIEQRKVAEESLHITQEKLVSAEKLAQISQLSQGISHQLGTPIGTGVTLASHINTLCGDVFKHNANALSISNLRETIAEIQSCNEMLIAELGKSARLLSTLKLSAQQSALIDECNIDVQACINDSWGFCSADEQQRIQLQMNISENCILLANYAVVVDVLRQLFRNAIDHGLVETLAPCITVHAHNEGGNTVIKVSDNGKGMTEEVKVSALQPFFSTAKSEGKVGLGLNFVNNLVTSTLGGQLIITSNEAGTDISLMIPN